LTGERTANTIIKLFNSRLRFMYRKEKCLSSETRRILSMTLMQCPFDYSYSFWYAGISQASKNKLQVPQIKTVRFI